MTFEEAGARFAQLQAQWQGGMLHPSQYQQMVAQLQVQDQNGRCWQIEPNSGQWLVWNGAQWAWPQQAQAQAAVAVQTMGGAPVRQALTVPAKPAGPGIWEGMASVLPGFAIEMLQRWPVYQKDPGSLVSFAVPSLLPTVLLPLVPHIGRAVAILVVVGCLAWLSWPLISQASVILGNAKAVQSHAGRGLVGVSLLYLIPRIWKAGK